MLTRAQFQPPRWLSNPHLQTLYAQWLSPRHQTPTQTRYQFADGDSTLLCRQSGPGDVILLLHGLEGCWFSAYAQRAFAYLGEAGYEVVMPHLRGARASKSRGTNFYHGRATEDLPEFIDCAAKEGRRVFAVGYSLGASILLHYLADHGNRRSALAGVVAISPPWQFADTITRWQSGVSRIYGRYLLRKLQEATQAIWPQDTPFARSVYDFDQKFTAYRAGYSSAKHYYRHASPGSRLRFIHTPTRILCARDDPFFWAHSVPCARDISPSVQLTVTEHGGHVGFIQRGSRWRPKFWLEPWIGNQLTALGATPSALIGGSESTDSSRSS